MSQNGAARRYPIQPNRTEFSAYYIGNTLRNRPPQLMGSLDANTKRLVLRVYRQPNAWAIGLPQQLAVILSAGGATPSNLLTHFHNQNLSLHPVSKTYSFISQHSAFEFHGV